MDQLAERTRASYEQPFDLAERTPRPSRSSTAFDD